jgi:hypothetical protein
LSPHSQADESVLRRPPEGCFQVTFTPKRGSWLNFIEGFFSKLRKLPRKPARLAFAAGMEQKPTGHDVHHDAYVGRLDG